MRHLRRTVALTGAAAAAVTLAACGSSGGGGGNSGSATGTTSASGGTSGAGGPTANAEFNAATSATVNASTKTGGTVNYALSSTPDSFDPGDTYYAFVWDSSRLWSRALTTFKPVPGDAGLVVTPDLATSLGKPSDGGKTWTYTIKKGVKYDDGTPVTSKDVKYAVERSNFSGGVLKNGPTYFKQYLVDNKPAYAGPYKDKTGGLKSIETPDDYTIVFHLSQPFADFDYLTTNPQTAPVPQAKDTGADYVKHIVSTGSYKFQSYDPNSGAVLVKNTNWDPATDSIRKQYADKIVIKFNQEQTSIDNDLIAGNISGDIAGAGVAAATQPKIVNDPNVRKNADDAVSGTLLYLAMSFKVKPFDNINCRIAVNYAIDKVSAQNAIGGPLRGDIASTVLPPNILGYKKYDLYPTQNNSGDVAKAKEYLQKCGHPNGFSINLGTRGDRPNDVALATSAQASLAKVGIKVNIQKYPSGKYFSDYAGVPAFVHAHNLGIMTMKWGADWPSGYGFLDQVIDGTTIKDAGNTNLSELNDPTINKLISDTIQNTNTDARNKAYSDLDELVMKQAAIVPLIYVKVLLLRPSSVTNVSFAKAYGMYDYLNTGSTK